MGVTIPAAAAQALLMLRGAGYRAVLVGGCVRDLLRGVIPHDWDIATSAFPDETKRVFAGERLIETGLRHGTLTVLFDRIPIEITSFRADGIYSDGRRPDQVKFTRSLEEDLARRDFTINAICLDEGEQIIDCFDGRDDLAAGIIRCIGDPDRRFEEDALRLLRALRFAASFGFSIEPKTAAALRNHLHRLQNLAAERILSELEGLLCAPDAARVLLFCPEALCALIHPLKELIGLAQPPRYHCYDGYEHSVRALAAVPPDFSLRLAMLLHDIGKPACADGQGHFYGHDKVGAALADSILEGLRCPTARRAKIVQLIRLHQLPLLPERQSLRRRLATYGEPMLRDLIAVQRADAHAHTIEVASQRLAELDHFESSLDALLEERPALTRKELAVDGNDLLLLGFPRGRALGETLRFLLQEVIAERLPNEKQALISAVREKTVWDDTRESGNASER